MFILYVKRVTVTYKTEWPDRGEEVTNCRLVFLDFVSDVILSFTEYRQAHVGRRQINEDGRGIEVDAIRHTVTQCVILSENNENAHKYATLNRNVTER